MDENGVLPLKRLHAVPMLWFVETKDQMLQVYGMSGSHFLWKDLHLWKLYLIRLVAAIAWIVLKRMRELLPAQHFHLVIYIIPMFKTLQPHFPCKPCYPSPATPGCGDPGCPSPKVKLDPCFTKAAKLSAIALQSRGDWCCHENPVYPVLQI